MHKWITKKEINRILKTYSTKKKTGHNARGVDHKHSPKRSAAIQQVEELIHSGYSEKVIMKKLQISRSASLLSFAIRAVSKISIRDKFLLSLKNGRNMFKQSLLKL